MSDAVSCHLNVCPHILCQHYTAGPVLQDTNDYFFSIGPCLVDGVVLLTSFALIGGRARQDHPNTVDTSDQAEPCLHGGPASCFPDN